ncbi:MAG: hypothetical protein WC763_05155 [Candidatus Paceibacterota bacterium]|jgi:hypothetical protein
MFEEIRANKEKMEERAMKERFDKLSGHSETVLNSLAELDLSFNDAGMVLKLALDGLTRKGGELKMKSIVK